MAKFRVTLDSDSVQDLFLQKDERVAKLLESTLNQILEAQMTEHLRAERHERSEARTGYRNGERVRKIRTRVGTLNLLVPQTRNGSFSTELFKRYQRSEQALVLSLMEMVVQGVSTRRVAAITEELCGVTFSKSTVSALCEGLTERVDLWNERPLHGQSFPFLIVDAIVIKVRRDHVVRPTGALIVCGVDDEGHRQVLGVRFGDSESEATWEQTFIWLKNRGLRGVDFVVSDAHRGLTNAISKHFQGAIWQRCQVHFVRNVLGHTPRHLKDQVSKELKSMFRASDKETARRQLAEMLERYSKVKGMRYVLPVLEEGFEDSVAVLDLPETLQTRLRTTNMVERLNEEIRRRERVIRIFPNEESAHRLLGSVLAEIHEKWVCGNMYLLIDDYHKYKEQLRHTRPATKLRLVHKPKPMVPTLVQ